MMIGGTNVSRLAFMFAPFADDRVNMR